MLFIVGGYASQSTTSNPQTDTPRFIAISPPSGIFSLCGCKPSSTIKKVTSIYTRSHSQPLSDRFILRMRSCSFKHLVTVNALVFKSMSSLNDTSNPPSHPSPPDQKYLGSPQLHRPPCFLGPLRNAYSDLYGALVFFRGDLVGRGAHQ